MANKKINQLPVVSSLTSDDLFVLMDDPSGSGITKAVAFSDLQTSVGVGVQGIQGTIGAQGITGSQGTIGSQGVQGLFGVQGTTGSGAQGIQGLQGTTGPAGDTGGDTTTGLVTYHATEITGTGGGGTYPIDLSNNTYFFSVINIGYVDVPDITIPEAVWQYLYYREFLILKGEQIGSPTNNAPATVLINGVSVTLQWPQYTTTPTWSIGEIIKIKLWKDRSDGIQAWAFNETV